MLDGLEIFFDLLTFAYCLIMFLEQEEAEEDPSLGDAEMRDVEEEPLVSSPPGDAEMRDVGEEPLVSSPPGDAAKLAVKPVRTPANFVMRGAGQTAAKPVRTPANFVRSECPDDNCSVGKVHWSKCSKPNGGVARKRSRTLYETYTACNVTAALPVVKRIMADLGLFSKPFVGSVPRT